MNESYLEFLKRKNKEEQTAFTFVIILAVILLVGFILATVIPSRVTYEATIIDKQTMLVDNNRVDYCLEIEYTNESDEVITTWICSKHTWEIGYTTNDIGDEILYKTWGD